MTRARVIYSFNDEMEETLNVKEGAHINIISLCDNGWVYVT